MENNSVSDWVSIGTLSKRTGVARSALHFYERKGLISSYRNSANHRVYPRHTMRIVSLIMIAQKTGFTLEEILLELQELPNRKQLSLSDWGKLASRWRAELDKKIAQLTQLRDTMNDCIGCGCLSLERCELINPKDQLGEDGAGPHLPEIDTVKT